MTGTDTFDALGERGALNALTLMEAAASVELDSDADWHTCSAWCLRTRHDLHPEYAPRGYE